MEFIDLPLWYLAATAFIFGVVIGSFLNVYIYRFNTGKSLAGGTHCLSCGRPLSWYDLFPLLSYVMVRGCCRQCGAHIPSRYFWVELITGLLFAAVVYAVPMLLWPTVLLFISILVVITIYDIAHMIIPDRLVLALSVVALVHVGLLAFLSKDLLIAGSAVLAGGIGFLFFGGLWFYSKGRWIGFGDAKLAVPLGAMVGLSGIFSAIVLSFWIGAAISLSLMAYQRYRLRGQLHLRFVNTPLTIQSEVPFAPFLILGFLAVFLGGVDVLSFFHYAL